MPKFRAFTDLKVGDYVEWKREWLGEHGVQYDWRLAICVRVMGPDFHVKKFRNTAELFVLPDSCHDCEVVIVRIFDFDHGDQAGMWRWAFSQDEEVGGT